MRTREQIMTEWDDIRRKIADGCTHSGPRDWFDGVLDEIEQDWRRRMATVLLAAGGSVLISGFELSPMDDFVVRGDVDLPSGMHRLSARVVKQ